MRNRPTSHGCACQDFELHGLEGKQHRCTAQGSVCSLAYTARSWGSLVCPGHELPRCHAGPAGSLASQGTTPPSVAHSLPSNVELSPGNLLPPLTALSSTVPGLMSPTAEVCG